MLFLLLPALRVFRVIGSSYRAVGTARTPLEGRLAFLVVASAIAVLSGGQLLYLAERGREGGVQALGDALWWSANLAIGNNLVFEPVTLLGRMIGIVLSAYAVVVFASVAATLGAFFIESRAERATAEDAAG